MGRVGRGVGRGLWALLALGGCAEPVSEQLLEREALRCEIVAACVPVEQAPDCEGRQASLEVLPDPCVVPSGEALDACLEGLDDLARAVGEDPEACPGEGSAPEVDAAVPACAAVLRPAAEPCGAGAR